MLYSIIFRFYAEKNIYFSYYPGESLHGMLFKVIAKRNNEQATILHEEYQHKPFTISPILPYLKWRKGKRFLKAGKKHFIRITFLEEKWYQLFMEHFLYYSNSLKLNGRKIKVTKILTNSEADSRCNAISFTQLKERVRTNRKIAFKFHSTTTFREGDKHIIFPQPECAFNSLLGKWKLFGKGELGVNSEDFKKISVSRYKLESKMEKFKNYPIKGFEGTCQYDLNDSLGDMKIKEINLLANFAFYSGVGYKTTMGFGQVARK